MDLGCTIHDAVMYTAPDDSWEDVDALMVRCMNEACEAVLGDGYILKSARDAVHFPDHYQHEDGKKMWDQIQAALIERRMHHRHRLFRQRFASTSLTPAICRPTSMCHSFINRAMCVALKCLKVVSGAKTTARSQRRVLRTSLWRLNVQGERDERFSSKNSSEIHINLRAVLSTNQDR